MFSFVASDRHYIDHMLPIYQTLSLEYQGKFYVHVKDINYVKNIKKVFTYNNTEELNRFLKEDYSKNRDSFTICASYRDLDYCDIGVRNLILMEHGAGQIYKCDNRAWNRSRYNKNTVLLLATNEILANRFKENNDIPVEIVGCPKLDRLVKKEYPKTGKIAISFHFDCKAIPETRSSWDYYKGILPLLKSKFEIIGHWHPRLGNQLKEVYEQMGIKTLENFEDVLNEADIYLIDNSSTLFEFAAIDKPVVLLNNPHYRRNVEHGMRFWEFSDIGLQVNEPETLITTINKALKDSNKIKKRRREIIKKVYPYLGNATEKFIKILIDARWDQRMKYTVTNRSEKTIERLGYTFQTNVPVEVNVDPKDLFILQARKCLEINEIKEEIEEEKGE